MWKFVTLVVFCGLVTLSPASDFSVKHLKQEIKINVNDKYLQTIYDNEFQNLDSSPFSLTYGINTNPNTFVSGFEANINGEILKGITKEKTVAKIEYKEACVKGDNAILVSQVF